MKKVKPLFALCLPLVVLSGCNSSSNLGNKDEIIFTKDKIVLNNFEGLGVEWGAYEDIDKITSGAWERSLKIMDRLNPTNVRCMINYDWFVENFDNKGNTDKNDDTWSYNFTNKYMNNTVNILRYCQEHDIEVAFGAWNVVGSLTNDIWGMMDEVTSDIRWAKMTGDVLEYLVKNQGITCIKYFVNSNEPNYSGKEGSSKNWNNTFDKWATGVKNVRAELDRRGLSKIKIVGGDTTGLEGSLLYLGNISKDKELRESVGDYGFHMYASNYYIDQGLLTEQISSIYKKIKENDSEIGVKRMPHIWESGLLDGKNNETDSNAYITAFSYGLRMADYTIQSLLGGVNSVCYWDFDDAMHFMYAADGTMTTKGWGMFSSLTTDSATKQEIRPWYHSSTLLTNLLRPGSKIFDTGFNSPDVDPNFRSIGVVGKDNDYAGIVAVNRGMSAVNKTYYFKDKIDTTDDKLNVYIFNSESLRLGEDGFVIPNETIEVNINTPINISVPSASVMILSTRGL